MIKSKGYSFFMETIHRLKLDNFSMVEIPIIFNDRIYGQSKIPKTKKNSKKNKGGSYKFKIAAKYKKPKTRGDKTFNKKNKK